VDKRLDTVKRGIEKVSNTLLPEKYSLEVMADYLDIALTAGVNEMKTILISDESENKEKIGAMNALTNLGRYIEIRIEREGNEEDEIPESVTDLLDNHG